jgi:hypothetical protein
VVYNFLVCWFTVYFFVDGVDRSGTGMERYNPTRFPHVLQVGYFEIYVVGRWIPVTRFQVLGGAGDNGARGGCRCEVSER